MKKKNLQRLKVLMDLIEGNIHNDRNPDQKRDSLQYLTEAKQLINDKLFTLKP